MSTSLFDLKGKVAIVTGATTGLGLAMAIGLAEAGADITGVGSSGKFDDARQGVEKAGRRFIGIKADLRKMDVIPGIVSETRQHLGRIDILINNAGMVRRKPCIDYTEQDWDEVLQVHLKSAFFLAQSVARVFIEQGGGGKIINIASMLSYQGGLYVPAYAAAKSGVVGMTRAMANEWASKRINVNAIAPGYFITKATEAIRNDPVRSKTIMDRLPAGRWGDPRDLVGMAVFLASAASNYCDGSVYPVDGGWLSR